MDTNILTPRQQAVLDAVAQNNPIANTFYLTGGTALAGFYLSHRYSEDLDFFSEHEVEPESIGVFFRTLQKRLGIASVDFQQSYNRNLFFLHFNDGEILKTEFTFFPFLRIEPGTAYNGLKVDSLLDIAVNKLFTIYQRVNARDYIDLYAICTDQNWTIADLAARARIKFDWHMEPLQLGTQFLKAAHAEDVPRMVKEIPLERWRTFFTNEAEKLKSDILGV